MCGIAGILSADPVKITHERLKKMTDALAHRGPDGEGHWLDGSAGIGLGHRRLSIIDLTAAGSQPMFCLNRYTVIHNGELYNHPELRRELQSRGYSFRSRTDTELIPAAYDLYGADCLQHFEGMFAFALWDGLEKTLFLARDRFGEKPLFLHQHDTEFLFASEMKALWAAGAPKEYNPTMLFNFISIGYTQNPANPAETFYNGIYKLPARSYLRYHPASGKKEIMRYWDPVRPQDVGVAGGSKEAASRKGRDNATFNPGAPDKKESAVLEEFHSLLSGSVERRLRSDVAIGASVSGGLDSSAILAYGLRQTDSPRAIPTFSALFPGFEKDESPYVSEVTGYLRQPNYPVTPTVEEFIRDFDRLAARQEEPFQSSSIYAQYRVYELAAKHKIKVVLDGQGADELLAGYPKYFPWYWRELYQTDRGLLRAELAAAKRSGVTEKWNWRQRMAAMLPGQAERFRRRSRLARQMGNSDLSRDFMHDSGTSYYELPPVNRLQGVLYYDALHNGLEELLRYADRNSMTHGVEVRLPFLDHRLAEFIFALPARYKIRDSWTKWILRTCSDRLLPPAIVWRRDKVGYEPPQLDWMMNTEVGDYIRAAKSRLVDMGILDRAVLQKKIQPMGAHAAENFDWRYLVTAAYLR
jgi:asparagine synthase (glutamine-hydrolysing)